MIWEARKDLFSFEINWFALELGTKLGSICPVAPEEGDDCESAPVLSGTGETELIFTGDRDWLLLLAGENSSDKDWTGEGVEAHPDELGPEVDPLRVTPAAAAAAARCSRASLALAFMSAKVRAPVHPGRILGGVKG